MTKTIHPLPNTMGRYPLTAAYTPTNYGITPAFTVNGKLYYCASSYSLARRLLAEGQALEAILQMTDREGRPNRFPRALGDLAEWAIREDDKRGIITSRYDPAKAEAFKEKVRERGLQKAPCDTDGATENSRSAAVGMGHCLGSLTRSWRPAACT